MSCILTYSSSDVTILMQVTTLINAEEEYDFRSASVGITKALKCDGNNGTIIAGATAGIACHFGSIRRYCV